MKNCDSCKRDCGTSCVEHGGHTYCMKCFKDHGATAVMRAVMADRGTSAGALRIQDRERTSRIKRKSP